MKGQIENFLKKINDVTAISFVIYMSLALLDQTSIYLVYTPLQKIAKVLRYCCYIIFVIKILNDFKNQRKITITMILMGLLSIVVSFFSKDNSIFILYIILLAIKNLDTKELVRKVFVVYLLSYLTIVVLSLVKIMPDWISYRDSKVRHGLGFCYATDTMSIYLHIILMYFYIRHKNYSWFEIILFELICIGLFYYTDARMSFILITLILMAMTFNKIKLFNIFNNRIIGTKIITILKKAIVVFPIGIFLLYNFAVIEYNAGNELFVNVDKVVSGRFKLTNEAYKKYDITLFGQRIEWKRMGRIWIY